jgi:hypothetical protein
MAIINTKGVNIYIGKGSVKATEVVPTAISKAAVPVVTVASAAGITKGDPVRFETTGFPELDGKWLAAGAVDNTANTFEVVGVDLTASAGALGVNPKARIHHGADMLKLCLSGLEIGADTVNTIDVGTFCDPAAQIPGRPTPGSVTLSGYADTTDAGMAEIMVAAEDQQPRIFQIVLPGGNGYLVGEISMAGFSMGVPLEGAVSWTVNGTQLSKIRWVH